MSPKGYGIVVLLVAGAFLAGKFTTTPETITETKIEYVIETKIEYVDKVEYVDRVVHVAVDRKVVTVEKSDGTKVTVEEDKSKIVDESKTETVETKIEYVDRVEYVEVNKYTTVETQPSWIVGVNVGLTQMLVGDPITYGGSIDYNIIGPIYGGAWLNSDLRGGLGIKITFR